jgi:protein transport protein SEC31
MVPYNLLYRCPRNPDLCAVASYDGTIGIHSLQGGTEPQDANTVFTFSPNAINNTMNSETQQHDPNDPFAHIGSQVLATPLAHADFPDISFVLTRPPRWLRKPVGSSWGFGGQLVSFDFEAGSKITIKNVFSDQHFSDNLDDLEATILDPQYSVDYCSQKVAKASNESERDVWIFLKSLLSEDCRLEMLEFLNFEKNVSSSASFKSLVTKLHILHPPSKMTESHVKSPKSEGVNESASNFALFPTGVGVENEIDKIITQCLLVNDYSAAVDLCLSANRIADAFAFSMMGPLELQVKVRDEYIARTKKTKPYCRVLEAITKNDLTDIVENCQIAPKNIWKELVAFICTHANDDDCPVLLSTLGARLEGKFEGKQSTTISAENSHAAAICYVGSGHLDRVVRIWLSQIPITEQLLVAKKGKEAAHLEAIQSFIEKIWIFRYAISFFDADLPYKLEEGETYTLQDMYLFLENFSLLAANMGKISIAYLTLEQIPPSFIGNGSLASLRDRVYTYMNAEMPQGSLSPFEINDIFACLDIQQGYNNSKFGNSNIGNNHNQQAQQQQAQQQQAQQFSHNNNPTNLYQYGQPQQNAPYQDSGHKSYQRAPEPYFPPQPTYNQPTYEPQQSFGGGFNNRNTNPIVSLGSTGHAPPVTGEHYQPPTFTPAVVRNPSQPAIPYQQIPSHQQLPYQPIPSHQQLPYQQIPSHQQLPYNSNNQNYPPAPNAHIEPPVSNRHRN